MPLLIRQEMLRVPQGYQGTREHGLKLIGNKETKENKAGNTGTKAVFREQGTAKSYGKPPEQNNESGYARFSYSNQL